MESKIQSEIIKDLKKRGWIVVKAIMLSLNGFPDIMAFKNGETIFIEVKDAKGVISEIQKYRINELINQKFRAVVVFSFNDYIKFIE